MYGSAVSSRPCSDRTLRRHPHSSQTPPHPPYAPPRSTCTARAEQRGGVKSTTARYSTSRDGREDRHLVAVFDLGLQALLEADVLAADVDVDEAAQVAVLGDPLAQVAVGLEDRVEHLANAGA